mgnify:CR=1 FL=1
MGEYDGAQSGSGDYVSLQGGVRGSYGGSQDGYGGCEGCGGC